MSRIVKYAMFLFPFLLAGIIIPIIEGWMKLKQLYRFGELIGSLGQIVLYVTVYCAIVILWNYFRTILSKIKWQSFKP